MERKLLLTVWSIRPPQRTMSMQNNAHFSRNERSFTSRDSHGQYATHCHTASGVSHNPPYYYQAIYIPCERWSSSIPIHWNQFTSTSSFAQFNWLCSVAHTMNECDRRRRRWNWNRSSECAPIPRHDVDLRCVCVYGAALQWTELAVCAYWRKSERYIMDFRDSVYPELAHKAENQNADVPHLASKRASVCVFLSVSFNNEGE